MRPLLLLAATALAAMVAPLGLAAQENALSVVESWDQAYEAAYHNYQGALGEYGIVDAEWATLNEELERVRDTDERRRRRLLAEIQQLSVERTGADSEVRAAQREWHEAGDALISALDGYLDLLNLQILRTPLGDSIDDRIDEFSRWSQRLEEVETQLGPRLSLELRPMPDVRVLETDTPVQLRNKAQRFEEQARRDNNLLEDVVNEIDALKRRQERDRSTADFEARLDRFDINEVPVGAGVDDPTVAVTDSTGMDLPLTPEQRLEQLETFRDEVIVRRDQLLERAQEFREEARRRGE